MPGKNCNKEIGMVLPNVTIEAILTMNAFAVYRMQENHGLKFLRHGKSGREGTDERGCAIGTEARAVSMY